MGTPITLTCSTKGCAYQAAVISGQTYCVFCASSRIAELEKAIKEAVAGFEHVANFIYECSRCDEHLLDVAKTRTRLQEVVKHE